ncbi:NUDIX domain-containing protein [soil metagenome]
MAALQHCGRCGLPGLRFDGAKRYSCPACGWLFYLNSAAAVVAILEVDDKILLARRARDPGAGLLDLPGGFVDNGETAEQALARELAEEIGVTLPESAFRYLFSVPNTYPFGGISYHTTDFFYLAALSTPPTVADHDEIASLEFADPRTIHPASIALPSIRAGLARYAASLPPKPQTGRADYTSP